MKIGPFILLRGALSIEHSSIEDWEEGASQLVEMQKYIPWWLGDMVVFGEARYGDEFWQAVPLDASISMLERFAGVARKYSQEERNNELSWSHHVTALKIKDPIARRSALRHAARDAMSNEEFRCYLMEKTDG